MRVWVLWLSLTLWATFPSCETGSSRRQFGLETWDVLTWEVAHLPGFPKIRVLLDAQYVWNMSESHFLMGMFSWDSKIFQQYFQHIPILVGFQSGYLWIPLCSEDHPGCAVGYALLQLGWAIFIISRVADLSALVDQPHESVSNGIKNAHLGMRLPTYRKFLGRFCVFFKWHWVTPTCFLQSSAILGNIIKNGFHEYLTTSLSHQ